MIGKLLKIFLPIFFAGALAFVFFATFDYKGFNANLYLFFLINTVLFFVYGYINGLKATFTRIIIPLFVISGFIVFFLLTIDYTVLDAKLLVFFSFDTISIFCAGFLPARMHSLRRKKILKRLSELKTENEEPAETKEMPQERDMENIPITSGPTIRYENKKTKKEETEKQKPPEEKFSIPRAHDGAQGQVSEEERLHPSVLSHKYGNIRIPTAQEPEKEMPSEKNIIGGQIEQLKSALTSDSLKEDPDIEKRIEEIGKFKDPKLVEGIIKSIRKEIEIKKREQKEEEGIAISSNLHEPGLVYEKEKIEAARKTVQERKRGWFDKFLGATGGEGDIRDTESKKIAESLSGAGQKQAEGSSKDTSIFSGKESIPMRLAIYKLTKNKMSPYLKGGSQGTYSLKERREIAKKISNFKKFGTVLQKSERSRIYKTLSKEKRAATPAGRVKIDKQIRFLKNVIGK